MNSHFGSGPVNPAHTGEVYFVRLADVGEVTLFVAFRHEADVHLTAHERRFSKLFQTFKRLDTMEKSNDVRQRMLEAAARRPRSHDELARRLRDGRF